MDADMPFLHPESGGGKRQPRQGEMDPLAPNVSPDQLLQMRVMQAAQDFAKQTGMQGEFNIMFNIETEAERQAREFPVFGPLQFVERLADFSDKANGLNKVVISMASFISVLSMMAGNTAISPENKMIIGERLSAISSLLADTMENSMVLSTAVQELMHLVSVQSQIDDFRNSKGASQDNIPPSDTSNG